MPELLQKLNEIAELIKPYLNQKYFLYLMGSIFLFGIVGQWITMGIYDRLIKKAENMISPKNKILRQIKMKFENHKAVNGVVANPTIMVERYINKYRFLGISLGGLAKISNICAVLCLAIGGITGFTLYEMNYDRSTAVFCVSVGIFLAFALDIYSRSVRIDIKEGELVCIITDFLENTMNLTERRQGRTAETLQMLAEAEARSEEQKATGVLKTAINENGKQNSDGSQEIATGEKRNQNAGEAESYSDDEEKSYSNAEERSYSDDRGKNYGVGVGRSYKVGETRNYGESVEWYMEEEDSNARAAERDVLMEQEFIINEVLAEFF